MTNKRWRIAVLLGIGVLVNYFDRINISVAHGALNAEFGLSTVTFGYLLSSFSWTYALLQLPMGIWLDRFGVKTVGRLSAFVWSIASFGAALSPSLPAFFATRLLLGAGEAPTFPANAKAIGYWFPRQERSFATAIFDAASKLGAAVGIPAVGFVLIHFGWRISFAATGLLSFLYFVAFWLLYSDPEEEPRSRIFKQPEIEDSVSLGYLLGQRKLLGLVAGFFGYNYCFYLLLLWLPTYFSMMKLDPWHSILYTSVPWIFATAADLLIGGFLVDWLIGRGHSETIVRQSVLIGGTTVGLAIIGPMFTSSPKVALVWITVALAGLAAAAPVGWSLPSLIAPRNSVGKVGSILNFGNQLSGIVAPIMTGYLARQWNSLTPAFAVGGSLLLAGIGCYIFLLGRIEPFMPEAQSI